MRILIRKIKAWLAYKPQYGENKFIFMCGRLVNVLLTYFYDSYFFKWKRKEFDLDSNKMSLSQLIDLIETAIFHSITNKEVSGGRTYEHIACLQHSKISQDLLANKTFAKALAMRYKCTKDEKYKRLLIECTEYILKHKLSNGIYRCEQPMGLAQDEGPVTAGVIQVLCETYDITKDERYLDEAIVTADQAMKLLFDPKYGYLHTLGYNIQTTNINSSFAYSFAMIYRITGNEKWKKASLDALGYVLNMQKEDGQFYYSSIDKSVYFSLYHYMVLNAIMMISKGCNIEIENYDKTINSGFMYGMKLLNDDNTILEPCREGVHSDIHSCTRAIIFYILYGKSGIAKQIQGQLCKFVSNGKVRLIITKKMKVTDGKYWYRKTRQLIDTYCDLVTIDYLS